MIAPDLKKDLIYKEYGHIGETESEKNIGDALRRTWGAKDIMYHALALIPGTRRYIILSKAQASTSKDKNTAKKTAEGEKPLPKEYLVIMELEATEPDDVHDGHCLGHFTKVLHSYCLMCSAGMGDCRHKAQTLWCQYHHWTEDRPEELYPSTIGFCKWARRGAKARVTDISAGISGIQCEKLPMTLESGEAKLKRGAKRNCRKDFRQHTSSIPWLTSNRSLRIVLTSVGLW